MTEESEMKSEEDSRWCLPTTNISHCFMLPPCKMTELNTREQGRLMVGDKLPWPSLICATDLTVKSDVGLPIQHASTVTHAKDVVTTSNNSDFTVVIVTVGSASGSLKAEPKECFNR